MSVNPIIIWTDEPSMATGVRDQWRAEGKKCTIRAANFFTLASLEVAPVIAFLKASARDEIVSAYRSEAYVRNHGQVQIVDIPEGAFGEAVALPEIQTTMVEVEDPDEADALDEQIAGMDDESLRKYASMMLGIRLHHKLGRDKVIEQLRAHHATGGELPPPLEILANAPNDDETQPASS